MPELPEVEVLVRHLAPRLEGRTIRRLTIKRARILRPTSEPRFRRVLSGAKFQGLSRRGKYLLFTLAGRRPSGQFLLVGHLGMTGRMYLQPASAPLPTHAAVVLELGKLNFVFEDPRYFGRLTLDTTAIDRLGPEPSDRRFSLPYLTQVLRRSAQAVKVRLLDQSIIAGVGNIYAGEALFRARIDPKLAANKLTRVAAARAVRA